MAAATGAMEGNEGDRRGAMKMKKKKAKPGHLRIRVVLTSGAALLGAACYAPSPSVQESVTNSPCEGCVVTKDGGHDGGVDAGQDAGEDGGPDGGDAG